MNLTDDEIRAAFEHLASQAPDSVRVRAHLHAVTRRHRQRRVLLMAGGAAGAAVAIGGPAVALSRRRPAPAPASPDLPDVQTRPNLPAPTPEPSPGPGNGRVPMRYRPTYLPDDFVEVFRIVSTDGPMFQTREWQQHVPRLPLVQPGAITLTVAAEARVEITNGSREITVNGVQGWLTPPDAEVQRVYWTNGVDLALSVEARHVDDGWTVVQDVARSVGLDDVAGLETPMAFGHFPPYLGGDQRLTIEPDGDRWVVTLAVLQDQTDVLWARLGPHVAASRDGHEAQLRGRTGLLALNPDYGGAAYVSLDSGLNLLVEAPGGVGQMSEDDLALVVNEMTIGSVPYVGWIWQR